MNKEIKNSKINEDKLIEVSKRKFRKEFTSIALVGTLIIGGYILKKPIVKTFDNVALMKDTPSFDEFDIHFKTEGKVMIDGKEFDLSELKEKYGPFFHFIVPMSEEEINAKFKALNDYSKRLQLYSLINNIYVDSFGLTLYTPTSKLVEFTLENTEILDQLRSMKDRIPNKKFIDFVISRINCAEAISEMGEPRSCFLEDTRDYQSFLAESKTMAEMSYEAKEYQIKVLLFYFELYVDFLEREGYDIDEYRLDQPYKDETPRVR